MSPRLFAMTLAVAAAFAAPAWAQDDRKPDEIVRDTLRFFARALREHGFPDTIVALPAWPHPHHCPAALPRCGALRVSTRLPAPAARPSPAARRISGS